MACLLIMPHLNAEPLAQALVELRPTLEVVVWPENGDASKIDVAICCGHPKGSLQAYKNIKLLYSYGAGADDLLRDQQRPDVPVLRFRHISLIREMAHYALAIVLQRHRSLEYYQQRQSEKAWDRLAALNTHEIRVGVMGLGAIGGFTAELFATAGFLVKGFSRSPKQLSNVDCYAGDKQLGDFLQDLDYLICQLPYTASTDNILNKRLFEKLPNRAYLINSGRGKHLVENDFIEALDAGQIAGACLDVFRQEPLPAEHAFWTHEKIKVTPHIGSRTVPKIFAQKFLEDYDTFIQGGRLDNIIDPQQGY